MEREIEKFLKINRLPFCDVLCQLLTHTNGDDTKTMFYLTICFQCSNLF